jgi:Undecaprenyl-phosphate glucose phosphotransferase
MIRRRLNRTYFCLRLTTYSLPLLAFAIAAYLRFGLDPGAVDLGGVNPAPYFGLLLVGTVVWAVVSDHFGLCTIEHLFAPTGKTRRTLLACLVTYAAILVTAFFYGGASFSRVFVLLSAVALVFLTVCARLVFRVIWHRKRGRKNGWVKILVVGADEFAQRAAGAMMAGQVAPCRVVGYVRLPGQTAAETDVPVHDLRNIETLTSGNGFDEVILALPLCRYDEIPNLMRRLESLCVPVRAVIDFGQGVSVRERVFDLGGIMMLDLHATASESVTYSVLKRAFDLVFSLGAVTVMSPLMLLIAALIKLTSAGPVLFVQERVGLNGKVFRMYKFRTMHLGESEESDTRWTVPNDPRCTRVGAFLRATSLDELPQFLNVMRGDMSVVGPRPERPYFVQKFLRDMALYNARHYMKVGITGWAQVNGWRGDTSISKRLEYDLYYLKNWSLTFDVQIILLTLIRGLSSRNAY